MIFVQWAVMRSTAPTSSHYQATFTLGGVAYGSAFSASSPIGTIPGSTHMWTITRYITSPAHGTWHITGVTGCTSPDLGVSVK